MRILFPLHCVCVGFSSMIVYIVEVFFSGREVFEKTKVAYHNIL